MNQTNLNLFFQFMYERHLIWYKRNVLKEPAPWTTNKILRDNKFTNIYRELDAGTIWYVQNVYPKATECWREDLGRSERNLIWYTVKYRLLNRVETFEKVGFIDYWVWDAKDGSYKYSTTWLAELKVLMREGHSIFTSAHRTCPTHKPGQTRIEVFEESLEHTHKHLPMLWEDIHRAQCLEDVFKTLRTIPNVGDFISYEICCDFMLVGLIPFKEDDWVNPGPGCRGGLKLIWPELQKTEEFQDRIVWLKNEQGYYFDLLDEQEGKDFNKIKIHNLTLRSIEHSLCEFSKYYRCLKGGRTRVNFKPRDGSSQYGQLPLRWTRTK